LLERGAGVSLPDDGRRPLHERWLVWHHDEAVRQAAGAAAKSVVTEGCGAADRTAALVQALVTAG